MNSLLSFLFSNSLSKNLINKFSGGGLGIIIIGALIQNGMLPENLLDLVRGMNQEQLIPYSMYVIGIWLIGHINFVNFFKWLLNYKINKEKNLVQFDTLKLQDVQLKKQIVEAENGSK